MTIRILRRGQSDRQQTRGMQEQHGAASMGFDFGN